MSDLDDLIRSFISALATRTLEIYNEPSLQHELGIFLRSNLPGHKILFERNVRELCSPRTDAKSIFVKREIDLAVISPSGGLAWAIKLKYPRNGQHPEQMFKFCQDIGFAEQLKNAGFLKATALILAEDKLFYEGRGEGVYSYFRTGAVLCGRIQKPTGARNEEITIRGRYRIDWKPAAADLKYAMVNAD